MYLLLPLSRISLVAHTSLPISMSVLILLRWFFLSDSILPSSFSHHLPHRLHPGQQAWSPNYICIGTCFSSPPPHPLFPTLAFLSISCISAFARGSGARECQFRSLQIDKNPLLKKHFGHLGPEILCVLQNKVMLNLDGNVHRKEDCVMYLRSCLENLK